jgi:hypothetical protein
VRVDRPRRLSPVGQLRLVAAFALQPVVVAALSFVVFPLVDYSGRALYEGTPSHPVGAALSFAIGAGLVAFVVTVGAVPIVSWLLSRGPLSANQVIIGGAVLGNVPFALTVMAIVVTQAVRGTMPSDVGHLWYGVAGAIRAVALGSFLGTASAAVFWGVAGGGAHLGRRDVGDEGVTEASSG